MISGFGFYGIQIKDAVCKIEDDLTEEHKLVPTINRQPIVQWFKEQWEKLQQNLRNSVQREQNPEDLEYRIAYY